MKLDPQHQASTFSILYEAINTILPEVNADWALILVEFSLELCKWCIREHIINEWKICLDLNCSAFRKTRKYPQSLKSLDWSAIATDSLKMLHQLVISKSLSSICAFLWKCLESIALSKTMYSFWTSSLSFEKFQSCNRLSLRDFYSMPFYDSTLSILAAKFQYQSPKSYCTLMRGNGLYQHWKEKKVERHN